MAQLQRCGAPQLGILEQAQCLDAEASQSPLAELMLPQVRISPLAMRVSPLERRLALCGLPEEGELSLNKVEVSKKASETLSATELRKILNDPYSEISIKIIERLTGRKGFAKIAEFIPPIMLTESPGDFDRRFPRRREFDDQFNRKGQRDLLYEQLVLSTDIVGRLSAWALNNDELLSVPYRELYHKAMKIAFKTDEMEAIKNSFSLHLRRAVRVVVTQFIADSVASKSVYTDLLKTGLKLRSFCQPFDATKSAAMLGVPEIADLKVSGHLTPFVLMFKLGWNEFTNVSRKLGVIVGQNRKFVAIDSPEIPPVLRGRVYLTASDSGRGDIECKMIEYKALFERYLSLAPILGRQSQWSVPRYKRGGKAQSTHAYIAGSEADRRAATNICAEMARGRLFNSEVMAKGYLSSNQLLRLDIGNLTIPNLSSGCSFFHHLSAEDSKVYRGFLQDGELLHQRAGLYLWALFRVEQRRVNSESTHGVIDTVRLIGTIPVAKWRRVAVLNGKDPRSLPEQYRSSETSLMELRAKGGEIRWNVSPDVNQALNLFLTAPREALSFAARAFNLGIMPYTYCMRALGQIVSLYGSSLSLSELAEIRRATVNFEGLIVESGAPFYQSIKEQLYRLEEALEVLYNTHPDRKADNA